MHKQFWSHQKIAAQCPASGAASCPIRDAAGSHQSQPQPGVLLEDLTPTFSPLNLSSWQRGKKIATLVGQRQPGWEARVTGGSQNVHVEAE